MSTKNDKDVDKAEGGRHHPLQTPVQTRRTKLATILLVLLVVFSFLSAFPLVPKANTTRDTNIARQVKVKHMNSSCARWITDSSVIPIHNQNLARVRNRSATTNASWGILICVMTGHMHLQSRVANSVLQTWAREVPRVLPASGFFVQLRFVMGQVRNNDNETTTKIQKDGQEPLWKLAGLREQQKDHLIQLPNVVEYAEGSTAVEKVTQMFQYVWTDVLPQLEETTTTRTDHVSAETIQYEYVFKVDDDSIINWYGLDQFLLRRKRQFGELCPFQMWGYPHWGRPKNKQFKINAGMKNQYCSGGVGYMLSRAALQVTVENMPMYLANLEQRFGKDPRLWHEDVLVGMAFMNRTNGKCQDDGSHVFDFRRKESIEANNPLHRTHALVGILNSSQRAIIHQVSLHPFKTPQQMIEKHNQLMEALRILKQQEDSKLKEEQSII